MFDLQLAYNVSPESCCTVVYLLQYTVCQANKLSESILGNKLLPHHHEPTQCNDEELFGVSYLYRQAGRELEFTEDNMAAQEKSDERAVDEGFIDDNSESPPLSEEIVMDGVEASDLVEEVGDELEEVMEEVCALNI